MDRCYRLLAGLALLPLPACQSFPRPTDAAFTPNPYLSEPPERSVAVNRAPIPLKDADAPPITQTKLDEPPSAPWSPPTFAPAVQLQSVEPIDPPIAAVTEPVKNIELRPTPPAIERTAASERPTAVVSLAMRLSDGSLLRADPQDVAAAVEQVNTLLAPLRTRAALEIPKLCFCRPIAAPARFGAYERLDENHRFRPGEMVAVYMELRNFSCTPIDGDFATHVVSTVEIHDAEGKIVFRFDSDRADSSLSPRQDYCHVGRFTLPVLPAGAYTLWLKATDVPTGRTARRSLDFRLSSTKG
jgi:hypothetical protein